jgi:hypothetical protein
MVTADPLERLLADFVLHRLDTAELADTLAGRNSADARTQELTRALDEDQRRLDDLAQAHGRGEIAMREWMLAREPIQQRLAHTQRQLAAITHTGAISGLVGTGDELRRAWGTLNLDRQHAIVSALIDHAVIGPGSPGAQELDPARVSVVWRH